MFPVPCGSAPFWGRFVYGFLGLDRLRTSTSPTNHAAVKDALVVRGFDAVNEISHSFIRDEKRFAYTTPKSSWPCQGDGVLWRRCIQKFIKPE